MLVRWREAGRFRVCSRDKAATGWDVAGRNRGVQDDAWVLSGAPGGPLLNQGRLENKHRFAAVLME